jgi:hypothetical protein
MWQLLRLHYPLGITLKKKNVVSYLAWRISAEKFPKAWSIFLLGSLYTWSFSSKLWLESWNLSFHLEFCSMGLFFFSLNCHRQPCHPHSLEAPKLIGNCWAGSGGLACKKYQHASSFGPHGAESLQNWVGCHQLGLTRAVQFPAAASDDSFIWKAVPLPFTGWGCLSQSSGWQEQSWWSSGLAMQAWGSLGPVVLSFGLRRLLVLRTDKGAIEEGSQNWGS